MCTVVGYEDEFQKEGAGQRILRKEVATRQEMVKRNGLLKELISIARFKFMTQVTMGSI